MVENVVGVWPIWMDGERSKESRWKTNYDFMTHSLKVIDQNIKVLITAPTIRPADTKI